ncbi:MAG TPA: acetate--CoA ligase family protein [Steroidobacter sp.]
MSETEQASVPTKPIAPGAVLKIEALRHVPGYTRGARSPLAAARLALSDAAHWAALVERTAALIEPQVPGCVAKVVPQRRVQGSSQVSEHELLFFTRLMTLLNALGAQIGLPVLDPPQVTALPGRPADGLRRWMLALPGYSPRAIGLALAWLVRLMNEFSKAGEAKWTSERSRELDQLIDNLNLLAPPGNNVRHFVRTAYERKIPWIVLPGGVVQYGWGRRARWLNSTFTDETPSVAARMARDKASANAMLRRAGIPAPEQKGVRTLEAALAAAKALGFPVVVKPANLDGGIGVSAGLKTEEQVRLAFEKAVRHSKDILVEKHVEGRDYRILVCHGKAVWANERVPAGVTGDGEHTVRALIEIANRDPRRSSRRWGQMKPLVLDEEAEKLLEEQGLTADTVLSEGRFARLRRSSNVSSGGTPVAVTGIMHPDNAELAARAARVFRLDIAGIDMIIPDISRSWREVGGALCEVNGQPQLSITAPHIYDHLFDTLIEGQGRIPTALVLGAGGAEELVQQCVRTLAERKLCVGLSTPAGLFVGGVCARSGRRSPFADALSLLVDPEVDAVVVVADGMEFLSTGLPFDRFDVLAIADWQEGQAASAAAPRQQLAPALDLMRWHCNGPALIARGHSHTPLILRSLGEKRVETVSSQERLSMRLAQLLLSKHAAPGPKVDVAAASASRPATAQKVRLAS